jgi:RNA polymerase sigma factor (sigma-70 family)
MRTVHEAKVTRRGESSPPAVVEFEQIYRDNVGVLSGYFARRCAEPQTVADLTSEVFVRAVGAFSSFDASRGTARAWLFGIAAHVFARYCAEVASNRDAHARLAGRRALGLNEIDELAAKIDAQRAGRELLARCARLPATERAALELVDLSGLTASEAAAALGVSRVVLYKRLSRARSRLRKEPHDNE